MKEIQPGTRLGIGRQMLTSYYVHLYDLEEDGSAVSFCGSEFNKTTIDFINALSKKEFIVSGVIAPIEGNVACGECARIYNKRVLE